MIEVSIPKFKDLRLRNVVVDFNGTLSLDGFLLPGVEERLRTLAEELELYVITSDTHGNVRDAIGDLAKVVVLVTADHRAEKRNFVSKLGDETVVAIGNGRNDARMLEAAALGIGICQQEGAAGDVLKAADVVCMNICDALDLLISPKRLLATLRG